MSDLNLKKNGAIYLKEKMRKFVWGCIESDELRVQYKKGTGYSMYSNNMCLS